MIEEEERRVPDIIMQLQALLRCMPEVCKTASDSAHQQTIVDYFYLIKPSITNAEFRRFTHLASVFSASRLLGQMNLSKVVKRRIGII
ncbi:hypothetical protein [Cytobacillus sp.]|uniref:hypothetical protein n=1 Tax=Cytobacillus sp. TaxID=2675269 RepID=UPI003511E9DE